MQETRQQAVHDYMASAGKPSLTEDQCSALELPITLTEFGGTVESLSNWKSPGPDGFTKACYKTFLPLLANRLKHLMPGIIHPNQTGFITGREARDDSLRAI